MPGKVEARALAHRAAPAVAADEIGRVQRDLAGGAARPRHDAVSVIPEIDQLAAAPDLDLECAGTFAQHLLQGLLVHAAQPPVRLVLPCLVDQEDAGEVTAEFLERQFGPGVRALHERRHTLRHRALDRIHCIRKTAALQCFACEGADRAGLDGLVGLGQPLDDDHVGAAQGQLDRQQQSGRPGADHHHIRSFTRHAVTIFLYWV
ncbi:hypothetical protein WDK88_42195 [Bradyrhizobium septentrionale]|uniref:Uncharacterized protein n=1 Tax=Bradyrhizobium septentrionale TaxID=1404411 RepID=A0ABZ2NXJ7_9BRAD